MTSTLVEFDEQRALEEAPDELRLTEGAGLVPESLLEAVLSDPNAPAQPPGTRLLQVIRPGIGRGRGTRYYSPGMLAENARVFTGARMFRNHLTETERKKLEGLPRPIEQLGGRLMESWWDGSDRFPADDRHEQGAVLAWMKPVRRIAEMIDDDPELIEASISALATNVKPGRVNGKAVTIVEGIQAKPISVDWVTEGGAGGKVLTEAAEQEEAVLESMDDEEVLGYLERERPGLLEAVKATANDPDGDGDDDSDEINSRAAAHLKKGKSRKEALALARQEIADAKNETTEGAEMPDGITAEALTEALSTDEGQAALAPVLTPLIESALASYVPEGYVKADELDKLVDAKLSESADLIRIEARGDMERQIEVRDMAAKAASLIEGAKLHPSLTKRLKAQFALSESGDPTDALNIGAEVDGEGNVVKRPIDRLVEAVNAEIDDARTLMGDLRPTRVRGAGAAKLQESAARSKETDKDDERQPEDKRERETVSTTTGSTAADELLESAGFAKSDLGSLWANGL